MGLEQEKKQPKIIVAGDVCLDMLIYPMRPQAKENSYNWRLTGETRTHYILGGASLLSRLVTYATQCPVAGPVIGYPEDLVQDKNSKTPLPDELLGRLTRKDMVHSVLKLCIEEYGEEKNRLKQWRVQKTQGFSGPDNDASSLKPWIEGDHPKVEMLVLDDTGNGFRQDNTRWPAVLNGNSGSGLNCIIHKMHRPLPEPLISQCYKNDGLWNCLQTQYHDRTIVVLDINDLREKGAFISRSLSWEKTALELIWYLRGDTRFASLRNCRHLVIRLGIDGAVCYHNYGYEKMPHVQLIYDPQGIEGGFYHSRKAGMVGLGSAFTAWLTAKLIDQNKCFWNSTGEEAEKNQIELITAAVKDGLAGSRILFQAGFGPAPEVLPIYPNAPVFAKLADESQKFEMIRVPVFAAAMQPDPQKWTILDAEFPTGSRLELIAEKALKYDKVSELKKVPLGAFKDLRTYDRFEIEAYRSLCMIMSEYLRNPSPKRPLSLVVFGPPGSGKSFGVQQIAEYVKGDCSLDVLTFNLSQLRSSNELAGVFHLIRDSVVRGRVPLVFFDEFDTAISGEELGWLKHFLAPMQDGLFMENGVAHPLGKAVFVFAGGISSKYDEFAVKPDSNKDEERARYAIFKKAKGPDFVSRLRARLDIVGIERDGLPEASVLLRRASVLRFMLKQKAPMAFNTDKELNIDDGLSRALLQVSRYHHGVRSMESILDMSQLAHCHCLIPSCLPSRAQMALHVNAREFENLIFAPASFKGEDLEIIAQAIHEQYIEDRKINKTYNPTNEDSHKSWVELKEDFKDSNRQQAQMIPIRLRTIGIYLRKIESPSGLTPEKKVILTDEQVEFLAQQEHERWMSEKLRKGWIYGSRNIPMHNPCLVPWNNASFSETELNNGYLTEEEKKKDRQTIRKIPDFLAKAGWELVVGEE